MNLENESIGRELNMGKIITEAEGLAILELYGLSCGEEKETVFYKKNGYINVGRSQDAFIKKMEQVCYYVRHVINEKTGRPFTSTKRLYEIGEFREELVMRYDGRINNGGNIQEDNLILYKYVFNRLLELNESKPFPYRTWANRIGLLNVSEMSKKKRREDMKKIISDIHKNTLTHNNDVTNKVFNIFLQNIYKRNSDIIEYGFKHLEKEGKIKLSSSYFAHTKKGDYVEISFDKFQLLEQEEKSIIEDMGMTRSIYVNMKMYPTNRNDVYYEIYKTITTHLKQKHGIKYYFESYSVSLLDSTPYEDIDKYDMKIAYRKRIIELTLSRSRREDYIHADSLEKVWYVLNTFILLKEMGIDIPGELYKKELLKLKKDQDRVVIKSDDKRLDEDIEDTIKMFD